MAEVAGLTVGVLSLVGAFTTCIDLFSYVSAARSLGEDYRLLNAKLDIEKSLLLLWARRVRLVQLKSVPKHDTAESSSNSYRPEVSKQNRSPILEAADLRNDMHGSRKQLPSNEDPDGRNVSERHMTDEETLRDYANGLHYDRRLDDDLTKDIVIQILTEIQQLLRESTCYLDKYETVADPSDGPEDTPAVLSTTGMTDYRLSLKELQVKFQSLNLQQETKQKFNWRSPIRRKELNALEKARWAIRDKGKFERLIHELSAFIKKLDQAIPDNEAQKPRILEGYCEDVWHVHKTSGLQLLVEASSGQENTVAEVADDILRRRTEQKVLDCLWFRFMNDRIDNVDVPHPKTLQWALEPEGQYDRWHSLFDWLRTGSEMYWISGKAGSGKSTLMRYVYYHRTTIELLKQWAGDFELTLASFFFWRLGTREQQTLEGLSRALLYNVLSADRSVIPHVLPNMWREASDPREPLLRVPSTTEMSQAFSTIRGADMTRRFCFFIDGLDEYSGNYKDGIAVLENLSQNANIRVVVSSRPITPCVTAFTQRPQLCLQELTRLDIASYINTEVRKHPRMNELLISNPAEAENIIDDLNSKSSGVFLWVVLACRSLLDGFDASDHIADLRRRVDVLPEKLSQMFWLILQSVEPLYRASAAKLLRLCYEHNALGLGNIQCLGLAMVDEAEMDLAQLPPFRSMDLDEKSKKCTELGNRLRSRCWGLLEMHGSIATGATVNFLHRSLYEFLSNQEVWKQPPLKIEDDSFDAFAVGCGSGFWMACSFVPDKPQWQLCFDSLQSALRYAGGISNSANVGQALLKLEDFLRLLAENESKLAKATDCNWRVGSLMKITRLVKQTSLAGFILALEAGAVSSVEGYTRLRGVDIAKVDTYYPLLYSAFQRPRWGRSRTVQQRSCEAMIKYLLSAKCDPNRVVNHGPTVWQHWVREIRCTESDEALYGAQITKAFLKTGADINAAKASLKESLSSRVSWLFGVGLSYTAVGKKHEKIFGNQRSCFEKRDHSVISNIGLNLIEFVQEYEHAPQVGEQEASAHDYASLQALSDEL